MQLGDYRQVLSAEMASRAEKNARYSLRAFARDLGLAPPHLSRVLKRNQHLSVEMARVVSERLYPGSTANREEFVALVELSLAKNDSVRQTIKSKLSEIVRTPPVPNLTEAEFFEVSQWHFVCVLQLAPRPEFNGSALKIAEVLGLERATCEVAIERLLKLGLLLKNGDQFEKRDEWLFTSRDKPSAAIRQFHKQMIHKALVAIDTQPIDRRYVGGATLSLSKEDVGWVKEELRTTLIKLTQKLSERQQCDALYQVNIQLFDLLEKT